MGNTESSTQQQEFSSCERSSFFRDSSSSVDKSCKIDAGSPAAAPTANGSRNHIRNKSRSNSFNTSQSFISCTAQLVPSSTAPLLRPQQRRLFSSASADSSHSCSRKSGDNQQVDSLLQQAPRQSGRNFLRRQAFSLQNCSRVSNSVVAGYQQQQRETVEASLSAASREAASHQRHSRLSSLQSNLPRGTIKRSRSDNDSSSSDSNTSSSCNKNLSSHNGRNRALLEVVNKNELSPSHVSISAACGRCINSSPGTSSRDDRSTNSNSSRVSSSRRSSGKLRLQGEGVCSNCSGDSGGKRSHRSANSNERRKKKPSTIATAAAEESSSTSVGVTLSREYTAAAASIASENPNTPHTQKQEASLLMPTVQNSESPATAAAATGAAEAAESQPHRRRLFLPGHNSRNNNNDETSLLTTGSSASSGGDSATAETSNASTARSSHPSVFSSSECVDTGPYRRQQGERQQSILLQKAAPSTVTRSVPPTASGGDIGRSRREEQAAAEASFSGAAARAAAAASRCCTERKGHPHGSSAIVGDALSPGGGVRRIPAGVPASPSWQVPQRLARRAQQQQLNEPPLEKKKQQQPPHQEQPLLSSFFSWAASHFGTSSGFATQQQKQHSSSTSTASPPSPVTPMMQRENGSSAVEQVVSSSERAASADPTETPIPPHDDCPPLRTQQQPPPHSSTQPPFNTHNSHSHRSHNESSTSRQTTPRTPSTAAPASTIITATAATTGCSTATTAESTAASAAACMPDRTRAPPLLPVEVGAAACTAATDAACRAGFRAASLDPGGESSSTRGGGVESSSISGGGGESSSTRGGGVESSSTSGGGVESSSTSGGGVESSSTSGGGGGLDARLVGEALSEDSRAAEEPPVSVAVREQVDRTGNSHQQQPFLLFEQLEEETENSQRGNSCGSNTDRMSRSGSSNNSSSNSPHWRRNHCLGGREDYSGKMNSHPSAEEAARAPGSGTPNDNSRSNCGAGGGAGAGAGGAGGGGPGAAEAAAALKERGNLCFKKGMYESAVDLYSQAIRCDSSRAIYYTNRALCQKKLGKWEAAVADCRAALLLEPNHIKALYLLGEALLRNGELDEGMRYLMKARSFSEKSSNIRTEIEEALLKGKKLLFLRTSEERSKERAELLSFFRYSLETSYVNGLLSIEEMETRLKQMEHLVQQAEEAAAPFEVPSCLSCNISMAVMSDPVITPSGLTYERNLLLEHLRHNGHFDPITRKPTPPSSLVPNYALKDLISWFLNKYPWAYDR